MAHLSQPYKVVVYVVRTNHGVPGSSCIPWHLASRAVHGEVGCRVSADKILSTADNVYADQSAFLLAFLTSFVTQIIVAPLASGDVQIKLVCCHIRMIISQMSS